MRDSKISLLSLDILLLKLVKLKWMAMLEKNSCTLFLVSFFPSSMKLRFSVFYWIKLGRVFRPSRSNYIVKLNSVSSQCARGAVNRL